MDSRRSLPLVKSIWALQWCHFRVLKNVRNVRILCKQTQKSMKGSSYGLQTKPTPSKVDMGSSMVSFSISRKCEKCENLILMFNITCFYFYITCASNVKGNWNKLISGWGDFLGTGSGNNVHAFLVSRQRRWTLRIHARASVRACVRASRYI